MKCITTSTSVSNNSIPRPNQKTFSDFMFLIMHFDFLNFPKKSTLKFDEYLPSNLKSSGIKNQKYKGAL